MPYIALGLPYTDEDLTDANVIVFEVAGGGDLTATVPLPQATGGLTYGYYNYKTHPNTSYSECFAAAVAAALTTADSETWTSSEASTGLPGRVKLTRGGSPATVQIKWDDAGTTFPAEFIGFDSQDSSSGTSTVTATWPAGRLFLPNRSTWHPGEPRRTTMVALANSGRSRKYTLHQGYKTHGFEFVHLPPAHILLDLAAHTDWYEGVYEMVQDDPNTPLEALWRWMDRRAPLRLWPNRDISGTTEALDVVSQDALSQLTRIAESIHNGKGGNPTITVKMEAIDYVP